MSKKHNERLKLQRQEENRRTFLKRVGWTGLGLVAFTGVGLAYKDWRDNWLFLTDAGHFEPRKEKKIVIPHWTDVLKKDILFGEEQSIHTTSFDFKEGLKEVEAMMNQKLREMNAPKGQYTPRMTSQSAGVPTSTARAESVIRHCTRANELLEERIKGLSDLQIKYTPLKAGGNYQEDWNKRCFIGAGYYDIKRTYLDVPFNNSRIVIGNTTMNAGCEANMKFKDFKLEKWSMFIPANKNALHGFFSESIPIHTHTSTQRYFKEEGYNFEKGVEVDEASSEAISHVLSHEYVDRHRVMNGHKMLDGALDTFTRHPEYKYVKQAIEWTKRNGVQATYDLYMESPAKFLKAIS
ncbi:MAG: hypothetical protein Q7R87_02135 [Nanoarchaeota archaeon]|nr:hypothetical protein [Nanoarchaeota archaeon]